MLSLGPLTEPTGGPPVPRLEADATAGCLLRPSPSHGMIPSELAMADIASLFAFPGHDSLLAEEHFGVKGFQLTASVPYRDVLSVRGL